MADIPSFLCDGVSSVASHNGVHRIVLYRLTSEPNPKPAVELQLPDRSLADLLAALQRIKR